MTPTSTLHPRSAAALSTALMVLLLAPAQARDASPFEGFSGSWNGGGVVSMGNGSRERVRCKANYSPGSDGSALRMFIACASDSYKIQVTSDVVARGGQVSGTWQEMTRQVSGDVSGRVLGPGQFQATLGGTPYDITLSFNTRGRQQAIGMRLSSSDIQSAEIQMRRN